MDTLQAKADELASNTAAESALIRQHVGSMGRGVAKLYEAVTVIKQMILMWVFSDL
jgi:hypothetical protein